MTKTMEWLDAKVPGFSHLSEAERNALAEFALLWSLFESRVLDTRGSVKHICAAVDAWSDGGTLDAALFDEELAYVRDRYYVNGDFTYHFNHLHLERSGGEALVRSVVEGSDNDPKSRIAALLIIVFRYRNNLFHGVKWQYKLQDQLGNFTAANDVLMKVLEHHGTLAEG